jgi:signal transduction histidine kinase
MKASKLNWQTYRYLLAAQEPEFSRTASLREGGASAHRGMGRGNIENSILALRAAYAEAQITTAHLRMYGMSERGLADKTAECVERFQRLRGVTVNLSVMPTWQEDTLPPAVRVHLLRNIQEALANVHQHAAAHWVSITLSVEANNAQIQIEDDGHGFLLSCLLSHWLESDCCSLHAFQHRLCAIRRRVRADGGTLKIESSPGRGACVTMRIPLAHPMRRNETTRRTA